MLLILLGVVAAAIIGAGVGSRNTPLNRPPLDYELNVAKTPTDRAPIIPPTPWTPKTSSESS